MPRPKKPADEKAKFLSLRLNEATHEKVQAIADMTHSSFNATVINMCNAVCDMVNEDQEHCPPWVQMLQIMQTVEKKKFKKTHG